jgi:hypothetical protein
MRNRPECIMQNVEAKEEEFENCCQSFTLPRLVLKRNIGMRKTTNLTLYSVWIWNLELEEMSENYVHL